MPGDLITLAFSPAESAWYVRVVFAVACLAVTPWLLASPSGGMFVSGAGLLSIGVVLLVAPAFTKEAS
jgi:uncharacterized membrane protein HdeD (DUF308 family)